MTIPCQQKDMLSRMESKLEDVYDSQKVLKDDIKELSDLIRLNGNVLTRLDNIEKDIKTITEAKKSWRDRIIGVVTYVLSGFLLSLVIFLFKSK